MLSLPSLLLCATEAFARSPFEQSDKPYIQTVSDEKNLLKYTANSGPYSDRRGVGINRDPPAGCKVDQVVMLGRHGERFPTSKLYKKMQTALDKITSEVGQLKGSLEFVNYWEPFTSVDDDWLQEESLYGPYSGLLDAYYHGTLYRRRYNHLFDGQSKLPIFVSAYQRDLDTARKFAQGFLQRNYTDLAAINLVLEGNGADTLAPHCNLKNFTNTTSLCPSFDYYDEFKVAAKRLNKQTNNKNLNLNPTDIVNLMNLVGYELNVRGSSPWADVFTSEEWVAYEYFLTSEVYCNKGAGSIAGPIEGSLFLNASRNLLVDGPEKSNLPIAFTFSHDTNIIQLVAAMGIDAPKNREDWDPTQTRFNQSFTLTDIVPQGARIVFERLICNNDADEPIYVNEYPQAFNASQFVNSTTTSKNSTSNEYVRIVLNEAVVPIEGCSSGPGKSCPLGEYSQWVDNRLKGINFAKQCETKGGEPSELTFFWKYNLTTKYNPDNKYEPAQATVLDSEGNPAPKRR